MTKLSEVLGSRELGLTKASKFFLLLYFIGYTFIQVFRAHKIVPRWYELNRMPTVHDALANPIKPIVFSGFWDEWILVGAHFTFPIMFSIIVITILRRRKRSVMSFNWFWWIIVTIIMEIGLRFTDGYGFLMAD